jgi:O-antigen ligase
MTIETGPARRNVRRRTQSIGFACALILVFLRFSALSEVISSLAGVNTYLFYAFAPVAILAVIASGRMRQVFRQKAVRFWLWFALWMVLAVPFSLWKGGSFNFVATYLKTDFLLLLTTVTLARTWPDCRKLIYAVAAAAVVNIATVNLFDTGGNRLHSRLVSTIGNSNDLAAHLLLVVPFLLFIALKPRTGLFLRFFSAAAGTLGIFDILKSSSRGALIALLLTVSFWFVRGSLRQKAFVGAGAVVVLVFFTILLPPSSRQRLMSFSEGAGSSQEALESSEIREYLLKQSIADTLHHPLFGVGPDEFGLYNGSTTAESTASGDPEHYVSWRETHNSYTQISSECGIPALVFYLAAGISTFALLAKIRKRANGACRQEIVTAANCLTIGLMAYSIAIFFVNFGYYFQFPVISGLVVAMWFSVNRKAGVPAGADVPTWQPGLCRAEIESIECL